MKILVLANIDFSKPYGTHTRPFYICKYLNRMGNEILVLCSHGIQGSGSLQFVNLKSMRLRNPFKYICMLPEVIYYIKTFDPHIIYSHSNTFTIVAYLSKLMSHSKALIVLDKHGSWAMEQMTSSIYPVLKFVELLALKCANKVIAASEDIKLALIGIYKIPSRKVVVVTNGVDPEVFHPLPKNKLRTLTKRLGEDKKIIIFPAPRNFVSNVLAIKFMYEVMRQLREKYSKIILLITGGGRIIKPKPSNVIYLGFVDNLNVYLNLADVAVAPYPKEALCGGARNKVLEYFACKVPVVSTKEGMRGIEDALPQIHFILANDDPSDFAEKISSTLCMDNKTLRNIVHNAYQLVVTKYNWRKSAQLLYDEIVTLLRDSSSND